MNTYRILQRAEKYFQHDMIVAHTELPKFPHARAEMLYAFLHKAGDVPARLKELFPLVTTLMQVALDTHDMVENTGQKSTTDKIDRTTQLRVLAGDYFSSRFYQLLAQAGQIDWIKRLSASICEVNRTKVNLYVMMKQLKLSAEEHLRQTVQIKTSLFKTFTDLFDGAYRLVWPEILDDFTRFEILSEELDRTDTLKQFKNSWTYWHLMDVAEPEDRGRLLEGQLDHTDIRKLLVQYGVKSKLQYMIEHHYKQLSDKISKLQSDNLVKELTQLALPLLPHQKV